MSLYHSTIPQFIKLLGNVDKGLIAGEEYAKKKSFDPVVLLQARLAPDQYPLVKQVQAVADAAKFGAARLCGKDPPKHPDTEQTMEELHARLASVSAYLETFKPADFEGAEARLVALPWAPGKALIGQDYLIDLTLPNLYFHVTTAYAILRHNGVDLGKRDFLGSINLRDI
jgi:uncharacterized protein